MARFFTFLYLVSLASSGLLCLMFLPSFTDKRAHITLICITTFLFTLLYVLRKKTLPNWYISLGSIYLTWMSTLLLFRSVDFSIAGWNFIPFVQTMELFDHLSLKNMIWYFGGNTLLFLPMGGFFVYLTKSVTYSSLSGFVVMILVELIQGITGRGVCDIDDLLMNILGIISGSLIGIGLIGIGKNQKVRTTKC